MIRQISVTFGTKNVLVNIMKKYPERDLALFSTNNNDSGLQLLDYSGKESIFKSPITYDVLSHVGEDDWSYFINYVELSPSDDQRKVLDANMNTFMSSPDLPTGMFSAYYMSDSKDHTKRIILTLWRGAYAYNDWANHPDSVVSKFKNDPNINYRTASYQRVAPTNN
ncbi:hypothetical protein [Fructilactobacillus fructivorans]|uniref:Monooxygenase n=1 Tax=Fructilactobacillus fructivorans TaxID=1614 RepID=A0A0C1PPF7_9LACO|nr:hypothetical protein [Fructilactobacillus fructivorans]KID41766.1 Monooxygenase [Fructilactobacillus fructivorans]MCT0151945.1 hypothetical protein [Fructilactobacillus fructivorans]MCT2868127.1 hypothetical protein [Fructilactobacillus fructivorans]MCT2869384.1 hypothetical protein [Fructilactobacillus fructivorans]MCT2874106.1 hypothetical protein [Fructilactobacillus fructivorans]